MSAKTAQYILFVLAIFMGAAAYAGPAAKDQAKAPVLSQREKEAMSLNEQGLRQIKSKSFAAAEKTFTSALAKDPYNLGVVFNLASTYLVNKKEEQAIKLLGDYIKKAPDDAGLLVRLGDAYFGTRDVSQAAAAYQKAYILDPEFPELAGKMGTIHLLNNQPAEAEKYFETALKSSPKDLKLLTNLSSVYLANAKPDQAISTAKKALHIKAGKELYITLATAYELKEDYKNALISFQRAADLGDKRPEVQKKIEGLKKVADG